MEGWTKGAAVEVSSARTKGKKGIKPFTYLQHVTNNVTGSQWVDVKDKQGNIWSFSPDQVAIIVVRPKRKRKTA